MTIALTTGDPAFDPIAPLTVNGYRFVPGRWRIDMEAAKITGGYIWLSDGSVMTIGYWQDRIIDGQSCGVWLYAANGRILNFLPLSWQPLPSLPPD